MKRFDEIHRIMYIAPRYHTNQVSIVRNLIRKGYEVSFVSQYVGGVEDHSDVEPIVLGYSAAFRLIATLRRRIGRLSPAQMGEFSMKRGFPPMGALRRVISEKAPDLVILRERCMYSIAAYRVCRRLGICTILYNQSPLYEDEIKDDFAHRLVRRLLPPVRMTPVMGMEAPGKVTEPGALYVPFVADQVYDPAARDWLASDTLHIFAVGKYEKRKNHLMLISAVKRLLSERTSGSEQAGIGTSPSGTPDIRLVIAGECTTDAHRAYFDTVRTYTEEHGLADRVTLLTNLNSDQMAEQYRGADLFVIPSTAEPASVSQLEAMSYGLPIVLGDANGTVHMAEDGVNGYRFADNDEDALYEVLRRFVQDPSQAARMGAESYRLTGESYSIEAYLDGIHRLVDMVSLNNAD